MTYAHTRSHEPQNQGKRYWDDPSVPLYPFGHGLSYSRFEHADLTLDRDEIPSGDGSLTVSATVTNTGEREADEVVQLYVHQRHGTAARPVRELKGFERVTLAAGESRTVTFPLGVEHLRYWNAASRDWVVDPSTYDVWVGGDSTADLHSTFRVAAGQE
jgi:beta-glucosidase